MGPCHHSIPLMREGKVEMFGGGCGLGGFGAEGAAPCNRGGLRDLDLASLPTQSPDPDSDSDHPPILTTLVRKCIDNGELGQPMATDAVWFAPQGMEHGGCWRLLEQFVTN
jgi:hypothetical protein